MAAAAAAKEAAAAAEAARRDQELEDLRRRAAHDATRVTASIEAATTMTVIARVQNAVHHAFVDPRGVHVRQ